jgi:hypothetical protein
MRLAEIQWIIEAVDGVIAELAGRGTAAPVSGELALHTLAVTRSGTE